MEEQTTVTIDKKIAIKLDRLSKANKVTKKEYIACALEYFEKYGINPVEHESPAQEMQKLIKRVDQVVAFIRKQEQDILRPMAEAVSTSESRINSKLGEIATVKHIQVLNKTVSDATQQQAEYARYLRTDLAQTIGKHEAKELQAFQYLGRLIDAKEKSSFLKDIGNLYNC